MAEENRVVLYGMWFSPFVKRIELALKIKGIPFEYVEEDLKNKSPELLKLNPVHKKVPVLVHNGNPICESSVILEYIDQVWSNTGPSLLPQDPYKRAQIRFWADFIQNQLFEGILITSVKTEGEEQEKVIKEVKEKLKVFEEQGLKTLFSAESNNNNNNNNNNNTPFVNGHELGFLDIVGLTVLGMYKIYEQFLGIQIVEEQNVPILFSWVNNLIQHPIVKDSAAPKEKLLELLHFVRQNALINKSSSAV